MIDLAILETIAGLEQRQTALEQEIEWLASEERALSQDAEKGGLNIARFRAFTTRSEKAASEADTLMKALASLVKDL